jgi:hypothetical protein
MKNITILLACLLAGTQLGCTQSLSSQSNSQQLTSTAPTATITTSPSTVTAGQSIQVKWAVTNATSVTLNGEKKALTGLTLGIPSKSMSFTLVATNSTKSVTAVATVTVNAATKTTPPPTTPPPTTPPPTTPPTTGSTTAGAPHIDYTDINVGSGTGGDNGNGAYVRIFGDHFGTSQGSSTVKLGGNLVTDCSLCSWSNTTIIAQLGSAATTGSLQVTVDGLPSNGYPFTVAPTTIVFVSAKGLDTNTGTFSAPFKTWRAAFNSLTSKDNSSPAQNAIIYLEPGVAVNADDGRGYNATISTDLGGSSPTKQLAIVGYPGGTVNVGSTSVANGIHGWGKYLTIANLTIIGGNSAIDDEAGNVRIINNSLSCPAPPAGLGGTACVLGETGTPTDTWVFQGNNVNNTGGNVDKTYHAVYFSSNVNHADVGWNNIGQNFKGYCRSIMFHATTGANLYDLHVHDNVITGGYCDGIGFASVDPSKGVVEAYNNVLSHIALASNPYGVANEVGIAVNSDPAGSSSGTVQVYNNTVVDAGQYTTGNQNGCFGVVTAGAGLVLTNNICSQTSSAEPYIESGSQNVSGTNNLWFGAGTSPSWDARPVSTNPAFVSTTNFNLQSNSPTLKAGSTSKMSATDILGDVRPDPPAIGAYE